MKVTHFSRKHRAHHHSTENSKGYISKRRKIFLMKGYKFGKKANTVVNTWTNLNDN